MHQSETQSPKEKVLAQGGAGSWETGLLSGLIPDDVLACYCFRTGDDSMMVMATVVAVTPRNLAAYRCTSTPMEGNPALVRYRHVLEQDSVPLGGVAGWSCNWEGWSHHWEVEPRLTKGTMRIDVGRSLLGLDNPLSLPLDSDESPDDWTLEVLRRLSESLEATVGH